MEANEPTFNSLMHRLKLCSEINHPKRPWSEEAFVTISNEWVGKYDELKARVEELEKKILDKYYAEDK